ADGAWSETFVDDDSRGMFHNAHEYPLLYPNEHRPDVHYYAPRLSDGYVVEAIRSRIDARAGLRSANPHGSSGLRGHVDLIRPDLIAGWAQSIEYPEVPVCLDLLAGGQLLGQVLANRYRADLERAGLGSGHHGFEFIPPQGLMFSDASVEVRRSLDGAKLQTH